jgi:hypothetical protein
LLTVYGEANWDVNAARPWVRRIKKAGSL